MKKKYIYKTSLFLSLIVTIVFILYAYSTVSASNWISLSKEGEEQLYYDAESCSCYRLSDRNSNVTLGKRANVWIKKLKRIIHQQIIW